MKGKKLLLAGLLLMVYLALAPTAFAGQAPGQTPGSTNIDVKGNSVNTKNYYEIVLGETGKDRVNLPEGILLSGKSDSNADTGLHVLIVPVTEKDEPEAYKWMSSCVAKQGNEPFAYYYGFFKGDNTKALPIGNVSIEITTKPGYENANLCYLSPDGKFNGISYSSNNGSMRYAMQNTGYYVLLKTSSGGGGGSTPSKPDNPPAPDKPNPPDQPDTPDQPDNPGNPDEPNNPNQPSKPDSQNPDNTNHGGTKGGNGQTPKTGDSSRLLLWGALMLGSFGFFIATACRKKNLFKKM